MVIPDRRHRRSIRLKNYDYRLAGAYFVTIVCEGRACLLGAVRDMAVDPTAAGQMASSIWWEMPDQYPGVDVDAFVVMPNHFHGIIVLSDHGVGATTGGATTGGATTGGATTGGATTGGATTGGCPYTDEPRDAPVGAGPRACPSPGEPRDPGLSLPDAVHRFKSLTTNRYGDGVRDHGWPPYAGRLWQRNYYEHIIRDERELERIRAYIEGNPASWESDAENPAINR